MAQVDFDDSEFKARINILEGRVARTQIEAVRDVADELIRLSSLEVPLDVSFLLQSANTEQDGDDYIAGFNTPYAARLHEHPEFKFQNGRKGKYLEDPLKKNLAAFRNVFNERMGNVYAG